ncbi:ATP-binding protein [Streptomyces sp. V4-01]|uniref:ATP-binding protein n=1 Tax=Actinacidiphila polyblastidii TaxID=3110430 RepID=A0ABU7PD19_9ACTN|nr:ATP-binding protein [Streptomyces sp. V4-01]
MKVRSLRALTEPARLVDQPVVAANYERVPSACPAARTLVAGALRAWGLADLTDADLVLSELVSNAIRHAEGDGMRVTALRLSGRRVRIGVIDRGRGRPTVQALTADGESGRGMWLVASLSAAWGVQVLPGGKCVWSEMEGPWRA